MAQERDSDVDRTETRRQAREQVTSEASDIDKEVKMGIVVLTPHLIYNYRTITTPI